MNGDQNIDAKKKVIQQRKLRFSVRKKKDRVAKVFSYNKKKLTSLLLILILS